MISSSTDELLYVEIKGHREDLRQISAIIWLRLILWLYSNSWEYL